MNTLCPSSALPPRSLCPAAAQVFSEGILSRSAKIVFLGLCLNRPLAGQDLWAFGPAVFRAKVLACGLLIQLGYAW